MKKKLLMIVNPSAGRGGYKANFGEALRILDEGGYVTTVFFTAGPKDATELAAEHAREFDTVACIGGDGTLSEVIAGLMQVDNPPPLGYIPMGTANDVATTLEIPKNNTIGAAKLIVSGEPHPYDVGGFGDNQYFAYIAAFGAFTEVSYATPQDLKKNLGHLAYVLQGAAELQKIESQHVRIEYDDGVIEDDFVYGSMSNSTSVAGIVRLNDDMVRLGDGLSELVLVKDLSDPLDLAELLSAVISRRFDSERLVILHTRKAKFIFDHPVAWTRDGEAGGTHQEVELSNIARPVELIF